MSLILKGIDMPRNQTIVIHYANRYGEMETVYVDESDIIQIPKGYGAIKDIDTFLKDKCLTEYIENDVFNKKYTYTISTVAIYNAPTILESEEENERK